MTSITNRVAAVVLATGAATGLATAASAAASAPVAKSTVTIKAEGLDLSGTVRSPKAACEGDRKVVVFKVVGTRGGGDDIRFASDTTEVQNGVGVWSTGNTGTKGRFYAKVRKTGACAADASPTVKANSVF
jgi:hypothetical protein